MKPMAEIKESAKDILGDVISGDCNNTNESDKDVEPS